MFIYIFVVAGARADWAECYAEPRCNATGAGADARAGGDEGTDGRPGYSLFR